MTCSKSETMHYCAKFVTGVLLLQSWVYVLLLHGVITHASLPHINGDIQWITKKLIINHLQQSPIGTVNSRSAGQTFHIYMERGISQSSDKAQHCILYQSIARTSTAVQIIHLAFKFHAVPSLHAFLRKSCSTSHICHSGYTPRPSHSLYKLRIF